MKPIRVAVNTLEKGGLQSWRLEEVKDYRDYYPLLDATCFDVVMVEWKGHKLSVFCDDNGLYKERNFGRIIANYPQPIFGNIVVCGDVDNKGQTLPLPEELNLTNMIEFSHEIKWITD